MPAVNKITFLRLAVRGRQFADWGPFLCLNRQREVSDIAEFGKPNFYQK